MLLGVFWEEHTLLTPTSESQAAPSSSPGLLLPLPGARRQLRPVLRLRLRRGRARGEVLLRPHLPLFLLEVHGLSQVELTISSVAAKGQSNSELIVVFLLDNRKMKETRSEKIVVDTVAKSVVRPTVFVLLVVESQIP